MRIAFALSLALATIVVSAQAPAFEVVSIKEAPHEPGGDPYPGFSFDPQIQGPAGRPVIDRSNLTGRFDIELECARAPGQPSPRGGSDVAPAASIFTAVQEQLGLKLEAAKEAMDVLVIEDVHLPTAD